MKRATTILTVLLVIQVALAAFALWPRPAAGGSAASLFPNLKAAEVTALTIYDKPENSIRMQRQADKWVLADADAFPADSAKVNAMLDKVAAIKTDRLITRTPASQARLKVAPDDYVGRIDFQTGSGQGHTLYVGSSPGAGSVHVRAGDRNEVYLAAFADTDVSAQPGSWIDTAYFSFAAPDVTGFTLKNANGEFALSKDAANNWTMAGLGADEKVNADAVNALVDQFASLRISRPLGKSEKPEYGMAKPGAELAVKVKREGQERTVRLQVGNGKDAENNYVVKSSDSPYYVRVAEYGVKNLVENKRDAFLQAPPTPAASATPNP